MESITLGEISGVLMFLAGVITSGGVITMFVRKKFTKILQDELKPLNNKMDSLSKQVNQVDIDNCKNYLQQSITALDANEPLDGVAIQRFYEVYDHYTDDLNLNSWVHKEVDRLEQEGKLRRK